MCGIVGYVGHREAEPFLIQGLRRLEYRGYDSAGVATIDAGKLMVTKAAGRVDSLVARLVDHPVHGHIGIGHTRWATHGPATDSNAHPHIGDDSAVAIVHNGVIENFRAIKDRLISEGYRFRSATDSEVIAHLVNSCLEKQLGSNSAADRAAEAEAYPSNGDAADRYRPLVVAVKAALAQLHGTYGLAILFREFPDCVIVARHGSPCLLYTSPSPRD